MYRDTCLCELSHFLLSKKKNVIVTIFNRLLREEGKTSQRKKKRDLRWHLFIIFSHSFFFYFISLTYELGFDSKICTYKFEPL